MRNPNLFFFKGHRKIVKNFRKTPSFSMVKSFPNVLSNSKNI